jgi:hypothetical protein
MCPRDGNCLTPMHNPDFGVAIEGARAAHAEHLLATLEPPNASRTAKSWLGQLGWAPTNAARRASMTSEMAPASASGDRTLGVCPPRKARDLVNTGGISGACGCGCELLGEQSFSVRDQVPPKGAHDFRQAFEGPKMGLASISIFGEDRDCQVSDISPALPGHRPASQGGFRVSGVFILRIRDSPDVRFRLVRDSRQRALGCVEGNLQSDIEPSPVFGGRPGLLNAGRARSCLTVELPS